VGCFCVGVVNMTPLREGQILRIDMTQIDRLWRSQFVSWNPEDNEAKFLIYDLITEVDPDTNKDVLCVLLVKVSYAKNSREFMIPRDRVTLNEPRNDWFGDMVVHSGQQMFGRLCDVPIVCVEGSVDRVGMGVARADVLCGNRNTPMTGARWVEYPLWFEDGFDPEQPEVRVCL
jgi:hypothetical protein